MQQGYRQRAISQTLQIGLTTVNRDISYLRNQAKANIIFLLQNLVNKQIIITVMAYSVVVLELQSVVHIY
jgi:hypothetical protein